MRLQPSNELQVPEPPRSSYREGNAVITNNTVLISPVGNRVSLTDLIKSQTTTLPVQSSSNISRIAASPDGVFLLTVDDSRRCLFINLRQRVVLHRISFKNPINALEFSPNGAFIAVSTGESDGTDVKEPASPGTPNRDGDDEVEGVGSGDVKKRKGYEGREGDLDEEEKITTAVFNELGNWLTFGCAKLGQLLVWEWKSESYILKQQGHYFDVNCLAYSPDSQLLATGPDDNKVKVWIVSSGFCFITFSEHTNAITALHFMANSHSLLTDQSGEVICAGTLDSFEIFVWSMKTSRLLDILSGHEGPVHGLMFSPTNATLASSSWDRTVRLWDVFDGKGAVETITHTHDVLTLVYHPDGKQLASSTLDGQIHFWDPIDGLLMYTIEGRRDISGGRLMTDCRSAANSSSGKFFTTLCYSADGSYILAGGSSKYICMYDVADQAVDAALNEDKLSKALILSLRLNEDSLIKKCIFKVSPIDIPAVVSSIPYRYLQRLIEAFADLLESRPHLEFILRWCQVLLLASVSTEFRCCERVTVALFS
ncbi:hypothetical protein C1H46_039637 [Malus baccata]|uniref:Small-subunit processome Utp12 domain-containing protein n=1 Tax=Malus baccata TaxID=106549 RepID=A0A540KKU9_MALBA|nr:hypothetical protein C1H46_039637 [Malus baccata]